LEFTLAEPRPTNHRDDGAEVEAIVTVEAASSVVVPAEAGARKRCFVVSPIGSRGSDVRKRSDDVLNFVITPAVKPLGYDVKRADDIAEPGMIIQQVINEIAEADLVVADLTFLNPNVFYELAVRHQTAKPIVTIAENETVNPFDINQVRTIYFNHHDLASVDECKLEIRAQILAMDQDGYATSNPILQARRLQEVLSSRDPHVQENIPVYEMFNDIQLQLGTISYRLNRVEDGAPSRQGGAGYEYTVEEYLDTGGADSGRSIMTWRLKGIIEALIRTMKINGNDLRFVAHAERELDAAFGERDWDRLETLRSEILKILHNDVLEWESRRPLTNRA
jgi:hypothetical protein